MRGARPFAGRMCAMTRVCALSLAVPDLEPLGGLARYHSLRQRL